MFRETTEQADRIFVGAVVRAAVGQGYIEVRQESSAPYPPDAGHLPLG